MQTQKSMFWLAALAVAAGCGKAQPLKPEVQPGPLPVPSSLQALRGQYRLLDIDGDTVDSGTLSVEDGEEGLGIRYRGTVSGTSLERKLLTPAPKTAFTAEGDRLHQKYEEDGHKIGLDYEIHGGALSIEVSECRPGVCLVTVLSAQSIPK